VAAPTLVQAAFATTTTGNTATTASVSWQTDDVVVVIYGNAGAAPANMAAPTNTGSGLSWTVNQSIAAASNCGGALATAVATASSSGTVTAGSVAGPSEQNFTGVCVWRGSLGVGNSAGTAAPSSTKTVSLTPAGGADAAICWGVFDWNADAAQAETPTSTSHGSGAPGPSAMPQKTLVAGQYTYYWCALDDQTSAGAVNYGIGGSGAGPFTIVAVEVKAGAGGGATPVPARPIVVPSLAAIQAGSW